MASYPSAKVKRPSRRKLGKGQHTQIPTAQVTMTNVGSVITLTFTVPVVVNGNIPLNITGNPAFVGQNQVSQQIFTLTYTGSLTGKTCTFPSSQTVVNTMQGGKVDTASTTLV